MEFEKYTDRAKGFLQSAQTMALRRGHQRLTPEHLLKVLLEDSEGLCANLIRAAGGDPKAALQGAAGAAMGTLLQLISQPPDDQVATETQRRSAMIQRPPGAPQLRCRAIDQPGDFPLSV